MLKIDGIGRSVYLAKTFERQSGANASPKFVVIRDSNVQI
jgi:hypothetical protein